MSKSKTIGKNLLRKEGEAKVRGEAQYVDDVSGYKFIYGTTVRSTIARGRIKNIIFPKGKIPWHECTVVTAKDIPGKNYVALINNDQPFLADTMVNHPEEAIVLLAHADKYLLEEARKAVVVEYEPLPSLFTIDAALQKETIIWGNDNIFKEININKGNVDTVWATADHIIEGVYETGAQEQLYIENQGMFAIYDDAEGICVWGSLQCPYYIHKALMPLFNLPADKVRVVQTETGGGFGGKEEYPSMLAGHASLLAWKSRQPVKMIYDRAEDLAATTKRHPSITKHRTAVKKDGTLLAMDIEFYIDGGAYSTLSAVVLSRGSIHAAGPYHCPNVRIRGVALATNHPPNGAFRGFGAPQSVFAMERHMQKIATLLKIAPDDLRRKNFLKDGLKSATNQVINDHVQMDKIMDNALHKSHYHKKLAQFKRQNPGNKIKRGVGFATFFHGAGFTGSGEKNIASVLKVEVRKDLKVCVLASSTEIGQGTNTVFTQIAAQTLNIDPKHIEVIRPDTHLVPNSGPTVASRTCMVVGKLVAQACEDIKQQLIHTQQLSASYSEKKFFHACAQHLKKNKFLRGESSYKQPDDIVWNDKTYEGSAYATYAWATYVAEVSVDTTTYEATVEDFVAVQEVGKVVHPRFAEGQIEGGVVQGIGYALLEKVVWEKGRMLNNRLTNYIIPTAADVPWVKVFFHEQPTTHGPFGAKGIGELPLDGTAPAIANALENALNVAFDHVPVLPEDILMASRRRKALGLKKA